MTVITTTAELTDLRDRLAGCGFITVDTEFIREKTYWAQLCLVQIGSPVEAVAIDPLAPGIDLAPLIDLMDDPTILKVFHAARQDIEIFHHLTGRVPAPLFDTQVAAMVCGFGDSVSYETLVTKLAGARLDKSSRFTDWSHRPLTERQLTYALADVIHLRTVYEKLNQRLAKTGRAHWLAEEMALLTDGATYRMVPEDAWTRLRVRNAKPRLRAILRELAAWREREAQGRDLPRGRVLRDEGLLEIAAHAPTTVDELSRTRGLGRGFAEGRQGAEIMAAVRRGLAIPDAELPREEGTNETPPGAAPVVELLRVLLKLKSDDHHVASKLIASTSDLEKIAVDDDASVPALSGWRRELFGEDAIQLKHGRLALAVGQNRIRLVGLPPATEN
ncbi:MAG: ribonuclease D [Azospirillum sp.]|nr:ribonuclease D [Azospirillum sp.]